MNELNPALNFGSISEKSEEALAKFLKSDPRFSGDKNEQSIEKKKFKELFYSKYFQSLVVPGESVGAIAAQSLGEPSTQMTLNTFHLAGHGGANMTLGIPRLRELLVTKNTKTPSMKFEFKDKSISKLKAKQFSNSIQKVTLHELLKSVSVVEKKLLTENGKTLRTENRYRVYEICFALEDLKAIKFSFGVKKSFIASILEKKFRPRLCKTLLKLLDKKKKQTSKSVEKADDAELIAFDLENLKLKRQNETADNAAEEAMPDQSEYEGENIDEELVDVAKADIENEEEFDSLIKDFEFTGEECTFKIKLPLNTEKILMLNIVEDVCKLVSVKEIIGIRKVHLIEDKNSKGEKSYIIQTEGVNFQACWEMEKIDRNRIQCNDVHAICAVYGIEAARSALVKEVHAVFDHYGIKVDYRHLYLVSDFMTLQGEVNQLSRAGLQNNTSPSLKMSFETTMKFLTEACLHNNFDPLDTPSGKLVVGRAIQNGTGLFDLKYDFLSQINQDEE